MNYLALLRPRGFTDSAFRIAHEIPTRAFEQGLWVINGFSFPTIALWTILCGQRRVGLAALEATASDMAKLRDDVADLITTESEAWPVVLGPRNVLLDARTREPVRPLSEQSDPFIRALVAAAKREASALDHNWIGTEHLLLAVIKDATRELRSLLERHDLDYERIEASVELLLRSRGPD